MTIPTHYIANIDLNAALQAKSDITVPTIADRDSIAVWRRKWYMVVGVYNDGDDIGFYYLKYNKNSIDLGDNTNWKEMDVSSEFADWLNKWDNINSAARLWGGVITPNMDGTIDVAAGGGLIKAEEAGMEDVPTAINQGQGSKLTEIGWDAVVSLPLIDNAYNFIYYEGVSGTIKTTADFYEISFTRDFTLGRSYRMGTDVIIRLCGTNAYNFNRRVQLFGEERFPVERAKGLIISGSGRNILISTGILWAELVNRFTVFSAAEFPLGGFDSSQVGQTFSYWYRAATPGEWIKVDSVSLIDNNNWDDNSGTLNNLTANRYGVHWVYVIHDSTVHVVYGRGDYTLNQAEQAEAPMSLPGLLASYALLVGKVIIQKGETTFNSIETPFTQLFKTSGAVEETDPVFTAWKNTDRDKNTVYAGPTTGEAAPAVFRKLSYNELEDHPDISIPKQITGLTILAANWTTGTTFEEYELENINITENDIVDIIPDLADYEVIIAAQILPLTLATSGKVTIYAVNTPTADIGVTINITRKLV